MRPSLPRRAWWRLRRTLEPAVQPGMHLYWRFARPVTLGVRAVVIDGQGRVFLVKHSYVDGWHFPGGGVEVGETLTEALARELAEEGNIVMSAAPRLHGIFFNKRVSRRDHVAIYIVREFTQQTPPQPNREIVEHGFFPLTALPDDTSRATRARLAEVFEQAAMSELW
ncbi:MAG TPA: NUDIX domain-containing protein [Pseudolabrys sp.]|nr:NUDIX domain-containing protein [Pseudolabrys sp.]